MTTFACCAQASYDVMLPYLVIRKTEHWTVWILSISVYRYLGQDVVFSFVIILTMNKQFNCTISCHAKLICFFRYELELIISLFISSIVGYLSCYVNNVKAQFWMALCMSQVLHTCIGRLLYKSLPQIIWHTLLTTVSIVWGIQIVTHKRLIAY